MKKVISRLMLAIVSVPAGLVVTSASHAGASDPVLFVSRLGAKCMDVEGERFSTGTRIIGCQCTGKANQKFKFSGRGPITSNGLCLDASGGKGNDGDQVILFNCSGQPNQQWSLMAGGEIRGINGKCLDLKGGQGYWFGNQPLVLWGCNGGSNQKWLPSVLTSSATKPAPNTQQVQPGALINMSGGNIVASGGGNILVGGAGIVASGGGNIVASGGGN